ncbi:MAG: oligopeptide/dipeptide ABC transporter ATP-binding protein [Candidatus Nanopelagicales bacterium]
MTDRVLEVEDLRVYFPAKSRGVFPRTVGQIKAVDGVSLDVGAAETLGLVGESGCGKSTTGRAILRLLTPTSGRVVINGTDVTDLSRRAMRPVRQQAQMIFQDPYNALNSRQTVGSIIAAPFHIQRVDPPGGVRQAVRTLMDRVGLNPEHVNRYPNEFSGGQRQRIGIARAIALRPKLIVCDEPVSALDVSIQAQILNLLQDLQTDFGVSYLFIAHDLAVVRQIAQRVAVMYLGHIVESASREQLYSHPLHPYTHALLSAVPVPDPRAQKARERIVLGGDLPSPLNPPSGCVFHTRCFIAQERCRVEVPELRIMDTGHRVACHFPMTQPLKGGIIHGPDGGLVAPDTTAPGYFSESITDLGGVGTTRLDSANPTHDGV